MHAEWTATAYVDDEDDYMLLKRVADMRERQLSDRYERTVGGDEGAAIVTVGAGAIAAALFALIMTFYRRP